MAWNAGEMATDMGCIGGALRQLQGKFVTLIHYRLIFIELYVYIYIYLITTSLIEVVNKPSQL